MRQDRHEVVQDTSDLSKQGPDPFGTLRYLHVQQLLDREREALLVGHHGAVVQPVKVGQGLQVRLVLAQLLGSSVQQADVGVGAHNLLAVELEDKSQHAVGGRVLGPEVDGVVADLAPRQGAVARLLPRALVALEPLHHVGVAAGGGEVLVDGDQDGALGLLVLCLGIAAEARRREARGCARSRRGGLYRGGRGGSDGEGAGWSQTQPLRGLAG